jgi:hypothetical protein
MKSFKFTGKRKNPATYVDVRVDSDRFDNDPDRYYLTIWAGFIFKVFCYELSCVDAKEGVK